MTLVEQIAEAISAAVDDQDINADDFDVKLAQAALDAISAAGMVVVKRDDVKRIAHKIRLEASKGSMLFSHRQIMYDWEHLVGRAPNSPDLPGDAVEQKLRAANLGRSQ